ncbi:hypothetical protein Tco_0755566 [Tanacetum coccineum]
MLAEQLVENDKVIRLPTRNRGHVFDIELIPFGHDKDNTTRWQVLRVLGERPEEKARFLMGAKAGDKKQEEIVMVRDFSKVFLDDLSGLPPIREIDLNLHSWALINGNGNCMKTPSKIKLLRIGSPRDSTELSTGYSSYDYDCKIRYHPGKANVVVDALSRKERVKPKRVRAMNMTLQSSIKDRILTAQKEAVDEFGDLRTLIIDEAHKSKYSVHPRADKMYYDLRDSLLTWCANLDISDRDSPFTSSFWQSMQEALGTRFRLSTLITLRTEGPGVSVLFQNFETCLERIVLVEVRFNNMWDEVWRRKVYAKREQPLEFSVGDYVLLKVSPWKGVVRFRKKDLLEELKGVHDTFHVSNLKKCLADPTLQVPLDEIRVDAKFNFMEEPVEILEKEFKKLKRSRIAIIKILYRVNGDDFNENCGELWFIVINNPFWKWMGTPTRVGRVVFPEFNAPLGPFRVPGHMVID